MKILFPENTGSLRKHNPVSLPGSCNQQPDLFSPPSFFFCKIQFEERGLQFFQATRMIYQIARAQEIPTKIMISFFISSGEILGSANDKKQSH